MSKTKIDGFQVAGVTLFLVVWLVVLAFWATVGYVAYHFISKWW